MSGRRRHIRLRIPRSLPARFQLHRLCPCPPPRSFHRLAAQLTHHRHLPTADRHRPISIRRPFCITASQLAKSPDGSDAPSISSKRRAATGNSKSCSFVKTLDAPTASSDSATKVVRLDVIRKTDLCDDQCAASGGSVCVPRTIQEDRWGIAPPRWLRSHSCPRRLCRLRLLLAFSDNFMSLPTAACIAQLQLAAAGSLVGTSSHSASVASVARDEYHWAFLPNPKHITALHLGKTCTRGVALALSMLPSRPDARRLPARGVHRHSARPGLPVCDPHTGDMRSVPSNCRSMKLGDMYVSTHGLKLTNLIVKPKKTYRSTCANLKPSISFTSPTSRAYRSIWANFTGRAESGTE